MKSNIISANFNYISLSIIIKNSILLLFIGIFLVSIISLFTKTKNNTIIEGWPGSWFESKNDKRRRERREREEAQEAIRRALAATCINPTAANKAACGANYYFTMSHFESSAESASKALKKKIDSSQKPNTAKTSTLNNEIRTY